MATRPLLYSMPISHYCISADRVLAFKGVPFDTRYVPYHDKSELIKATGQDYVPTLVWEGKPVMWSDIPDFLEKAQPKPTLYPWGKKGLATTLEHWGHQVLEERVWRYVLEMRRGEFREDMNKHLGMVEAMLDGQDWMLGEPSLADFGVYGSLSPLWTAGEKIPKEFPQLANWVSRIQKLR